MRRRLSHVFVSLATFMVGVLAAWALFQSFADKKLSSDVAENERAQKQAHQPVVSNTPSPKIEDIDFSDPYEIEFFINSNPDFFIFDLWTKLGIENEFNGIWSWEQEYPFFASCGQCEAESDEYNLDGEPGKEVILRIENRSREVGRYIIYTRDRTDGSFRLIGHIDHDFGRYQMPRHHFVVSGGHSFLVVQVQTQSGTGVAMYFNRLFSVRDGKLEEILTFPAEGHESLSSADPQREFSGKIMGIDVNRGRIRVELRLTVNYSLPDVRSGSVSKNWTKQQRAVYVKPAGARKAKLDPTESNISQAEIDAVYDIGTLSDEDFMKYNRKELKGTGWKPARW